MQRMATVIWKKKQRFVSQKGKCKAFQGRVRSELWINGSHTNADGDLYPGNISKAANFSGTVLAPSQALYAPIHFSSDPV